eukprot:TRINITY_DN3387_c0_g2_i1.p2 TRINITY_DN3387_c0_g2~~TRINITY_DN3387_c0_g2_i1.p2  ORF type:complete len:220 (+),score=47.02 TRINITY_DN3387_c0_g2_i1:86-745(+)
MAPHLEQHGRRNRSLGVALVAAHVGVMAWLMSGSSEGDELVARSDSLAFTAAPAGLPDTFRPLLSKRAGYGSSADALETGSLLAASEDAPRGRPGGVAMGRMRWVQKERYGDGWRFGGRNMWLEEAMGSNWMNITVLKTYTFPSGRVKPRVMTKLRQSDHKRAVRYVKRLRRMGLMPYHRIQAKVATDPAAQRPPPPSRGQKSSTKQVSAEGKASMDTM